MEESISGGRRKKYARPTINSYMYANAKALSDIGILLDNPEMARKYGMKADSLKTLVQNKLWNEKHQSSRLFVAILVRQYAKQSVLFLGILTYPIVKPSIMRKHGAKQWMKKDLPLLTD